MKRLLVAALIALLFIFCFIPSKSVYASTVNMEHFFEADLDPDLSAYPLAPIFSFRDVFGAPYKAKLNRSIPLCPYDKNSFVHEGYKVNYEDEHYYSQLGIDVSRHIGDIDWNRVKADGYEFAIVRLAYRTYGIRSGTLNLDKNFLKNFCGAQDSGLEVGVYVYSQAINEMEAIEEADFVIDELERNHLEPELPIVYDPESVIDDIARTDHVTPAQFTLNAIAFCKRVKERGYVPMIYANMLWEAYKLDLSRLPDIPIWYADYEEYPQTPYMFEYWQYTNEGRVDGIESPVDIDIRLIPKN